MLIGIDIDDVLYQTSIMIRQHAPKALRALGLPDTMDESLYHLRDRCNVNNDQYKELESRLKWISLEYISAPAVRALKLLKRTNPEVEYCIVTWRPEEDTIPILQLIRQYFYLDIKRWYCLPEETSKADFCEEHGIRLMLDDNTDVIRGFETKSTNHGILVSTEHVLHNKEYAGKYDLVLNHWNELHSLYEIVCRKEKNEA